ncbi:MAG TPA: LysE family transporter [Gammaproteobacteria bacterium]|nr:LysE family transporter [Gammaproteobacteria bacterium]MDE2023589.1 LysE family transporter [Gammaproteobacteria bacterium]HKV97677.1 LysE family transporter [Gammaproteobacteria bacterium]
MNAFWTGVLAGYGIAIPVGAIAILILETGLREGFARGFFAGAGAASADFLYAAVAVAAGSAAAVAVASFALPLKIASGLVLLALGGYGMWKVFKPKSTGNSSANVNNHGSTYFQFLGLTLLNPMTIVYFAALILGGSAGARAGVTAAVLFVLGAGLASLSWQTLLAACASLLKKRLPAGMQRLFSLAGNLVVAAFGVGILLRLAV